MRTYNLSSHSKFIAIGISYHKADEVVRGQFSLSETSREALLKHSKDLDIDGLIAISTCNRTELYGFADNSDVLIDLLCSYTHGQRDTFLEVGYVRENYDAIAHMFRVGTGLDSQILGDFEIISQLRKAFGLSKKHKVATPFLERLSNSVIQASKRIKNETGISSGATSVAFAAVQYLLARVPEISKKNILLVGAGKIGRNTCENLLKHSGGNQITLINRTLETAEELGVKFNLKVKSWSDLENELSRSEVIIVATGALHYTVTPQMLPSAKQQWIIDLSIPLNVDPAVERHDQVTLVHLDQLSKITDETLERRKKFIPKAEGIITEVQSEFEQWMETRKFAPVIKALKSKLYRMKQDELEYQSKKLQAFDSQQAEVISDRIIHKITRQFANHLKDSNYDTEKSLELIQQIFQLDASNK